MRNMWDERECVHTISLSLSLHGSLFLYLLATLFKYWASGNQMYIVLYINQPFSFLRSCEKGIFERKMIANCLCWELIVCAILQWIYTLFCIRLLFLVCVWGLEAVFPGFSSKVIPVITLVMNEWLLYQYCRLVVNLFLTTISLDTKSFFTLLWIT